MPALGALGCTCKPLRQVLLEHDSVWRAAYGAAAKAVQAAVQHASEHGLVDRPYRQEAIGWRVSVLNEELGEWESGVVVAVEGEHFQVRYADGALVWERETRVLDQWHCRGKSRIVFEAGAPSRT